jgi:hypothetical protein
LTIKPQRWTSYTDENCVIVEGLIKEDRRFKVGEIAEVRGIAEIISDLNFPVKYVFAGIRKCSSSSTEVKEWLLQDL